MKKAEVAVLVQDKDDFFIFALPLSHLDDASIKEKDGREVFLCKE